MFSSLAPRLLPLVSLLLVVLTGCAHVPLDARYAGPQPLPRDLAAYYAYPQRTAEATVTQTAEQPTFREFLVQFPLLVEGFQPTEPVVEFEWFESTEPGPRPAILFNPILGGDYPLERGICRHFAARGFHVALVHRKALKISPEHPVEHLELLLRQGILRIRQAVDWMAQHPRVDPQRMGSFGISMGGMASVITAAVEPRLKAHVVALAGGGIADILVTSKDKLLTKPRAKYLARNQMDLKTLEGLLQQHIRTDPLLLAPYVDSRRFFCFIALADRTIGTSNALRLRRALGNPPTTYLLAGHYTAYLYLPHLKRASLRFFQHQLEQ